MMMIWRKYLRAFLGCKGLSNDDIEVAGATAFQEIRPGAGFNTGDFVEKTLGGRGVVERLLRVFKHSMKQ